MKTIKQIADEIGVSKQQVYRYIKSHEIDEVHQEAHQRNSVRYYDEVAIDMIKTAFAGNSESDEVHQKHINESFYEALMKQIEVLENELEVKNKQIEQLNDRLDKSQSLLENQQLLCARAQQKIEELEDKSKVAAVNEKKWWHIWKA